MFSCAGTYVQPNKDTFEAVSLKIKPFRFDQNEMYPPEVLMYVDKKKVVDVISYKDPLFGTAKLKVASTEAYVEAGKRIIDLHITAYNKRRAKFNKLSIEADFISGNSYEIDIDVPQGLSLVEDINADTTAVIKVINTSVNLEVVENKITLKDSGWKPRSVTSSDDNSVSDAIIQSTVQGIIFTQ